MVFIEICICLLFADMPALTEFVSPADGARLTDVRRQMVRRTRLLTLALAFWAPVFVGIYLILGCSKSANIVALAGAILIANLRLLAWGAPPAACANLTVGTAFATFSALAILNGGHYSPPTVWYATVPVLAVWLVDLRSGVCWAVASTLAISALYVARIHGVLLPSTIGEMEMRFLEFSGLLGLVLCVFALAGFNRAVEEGARNSWAEALQRAESADRARCAFFAGVSHELRTPLTAVIGSIEWLSDSMTSESTSDDRRCTLEVARRNIDQIASIVDDLLRMKQSTTGHLVLERLEMNPRRLVEEAAANARAAAFFKGLELKTIADPSLPPRVFGSPDRIARILTHLIENAINFTPSGQVTVSARLDRLHDGTLQFVVAVADTGIGMTADQVSRIQKDYLLPGSPFEWRTENERFGLCQASRLATSIRGRISVESRPNAGSTFTLTAPIVLSPESTLAARRSLGCEDRRNESTVAATAAADSLRGLRILFAEDSPDVQRVLTHFLEKAGAQPVEIVGNGRLAVERMTVNGTLTGPLLVPSPYDVVLMDMHMPEMNGYEATAQLRALGHRGPIIAVTAYAMPGDREKCMLAGCDDFLPKPIVRDRLIETIVRQVGRRQVAARVTPDAGIGQPRSG